MNLERYQYLTDNDFKDYVFYSVGPNGKIKKVVHFSKIQGLAAYNLGFGDEDPKTGKVDDSVVTNNNDRDIVLATVASTIADFSIHYNNPFIYAKGSTSVRTRLYQIGISKLLGEICVEFEVYGLKNENWDEFQRNVNYDAFLVKRK